MFVIFIPPLSSDKIRLNLSSIILISIIALSKIFYLTNDIHIISSKKKYFNLSFNTILR